LRPPPPKNAGKPFRIFYIIATPYLTPNGTEEFERGYLQNEPEVIASQSRKKIWLKCVAVILFTSSAIIKKKFTLL
jgi:hypothetical protein